MVKPKPMPTSKHRPKHKAKKKENNIKKAKHKEAMNELKNKVANMPVSYTYHKDADHVKIPMRAWQMLNALAKELQPLAMLVSTFEQLGQDHINDGTLIPVFKEDLEVEMKDGAPLLQDGQVQHKLKDSFWAKKASPAEPVVEAPPLIVDPSTGTEVKSTEEAQPQG